MREFGLEAYFTRWEFKARIHMTASDAESMTLPALLDMADPQDREAYEAHWLGYSETSGAPELRDVIATQYRGLDASNVLCLAGAQEGIYAAMRSLLSRDDHAITFVPNYQAAETVPLDICAVSGLPLREDQGWQIDLDALEQSIRPNSKLVSINFPNNPTGATLRAGNYAGLVDLCRKHDLWLFSDEVSRGLELDPKCRMEPAATVYEKAISLNGSSKALGLPGLRIGWLASQNTTALHKINQYKNYLSICCAGPSERLAVIALKASEQILARNRAILSINLALLDGFFGAYTDLFEWRRPDGGCVAFPRYCGPDGVEAFCQRVLEEEGVLLIPPSLYRSELLPAPTDRFRIGFGRRNMPNGLVALRRYVDRHRANTVS